MVNKRTIQQPEINIGLIGHVDHGKTTLLQALTGIWTDTHSEEIKRGITIRLGYANATFYKCKKCKEGYSYKEKCPNCNEKGEAVRMVSFIDAPGHETLMATMLGGAAIMDAALLLVAANEKCPQPQTREHLTALEIIGVKNIIIVQNKIDLADEEQVLKNYNEIKEFIKGTIAEKAPIIPVSAQHNANIDILIKTIIETFEVPKRDLKEDPLMFVARSFDVNRPGIDVDNLFGGVLGGALKQGVLKKRDEIEIRPGIKENNKWISLSTTIVNLMTGKSEIDEVNPGGSIAVLTDLDPSIVKADNLIGSVVGLKGKLPEVWYEFNLKPVLLQRVVGSKEELNVEPIKMNESLMLNVNSAVTVGIVDSITKGLVHVRLKLPVCALSTDRVTISRMIGSRFRLIGYSNGIS